MKRSVVALSLVALAGGPVLGAVTQKPSPAAKEKSKKKFDPEAERVLRAMDSYLGSLQTFRVESEATDEVVLENGTKLQSLTTSKLSLRRPNALRSEQIGPGARMTAWYDGKELTLYCRSSQTYGTVPAPPNLDAMLDMARKKYGIEAHAADLAYSHPYDVLTKHAKSGQYLGLESVDGLAAHHLAFQKDDVDWQLWVQDGKQPLPLRYVITTKTVPAQPQFTTRFKHWETEAQIAPSTFTPQPPAGSKHVDSLPSDCPAPR
ncbi:MAG: DUF2092 domain-containing protein [Polyangiales bacterium]